MRLVVGVLVLVALAGSAHAGATFEFNMGVGAGIGDHDPGSGTADDARGTKVGFASPDIAAGVRLGSLAITGRLAVILMKDDSYVFVGPAVQWWPSDRVFLGGGLGLGGIELDKAAADDTKGYQTLGLSLRAGLNLRPERRHRLTVSVEVTPGIYPNGISTGIALLGGYQYW